MSTIALTSIIFGALALLIGAFSRAVLLPTAKWLQTARGWSDQFVTELAVAVPIGIGIVIFTACLGWLWR